MGGRFIGAGEVFDYGREPRFEQLIHLCRTISMLRAAVAFCFIGRSLCRGARQVRRLPGVRLLVAKHLLRQPAREQLERALVFLHGGGAAVLWAMSAVGVERKGAIGKPR